MRSKRLGLNTESLTHHQNKELEDYLGKLQDTLTTVQVIHQAIMLNADEPNTKILRELNKCQRRVNKLMEIINRFDDVDEDIIQQMMESTSPQLREIDNECELRNLQWYKFTNNKNQYENESGTDSQFSYDSSFAKPWRPAFKPVHYAREINGKKTFIPNVRILAQEVNGKAMPLNVPRSLTAPDMQYRLINKPIVERILVTGTKIKKIYGVKFLNKKLRVTNEWNRWWTIPSEDRIVYVKEQYEIHDLVKICKVDSNKKLVYKQVKVPGSAGFKFGKQLVKDSKVNDLEKIAYSAQLAPPAEYKDGALKRHYGYSNDSRYNVVGNEGKWAEQMRNKFLRDLHEGNVNVTKYVEWKTKESNRIPDPDDNTKFLKGIEHRVNNFGQSKKVFITEEMSIKYQAYRVYPTKIGKLEINVLIFCDIKPISDKHFVTYDEMKNSKGFYPEVLFVQH